MSRIVFAEGAPRLVSIALAASFVACSGDDDGAPLARAICERTALLSALEGARAGQTVSLGACTIDGPIEVPAGVRLEGEGVDLSVIRNTSASPGVLLRAGEATTALVDLSVEQASAAYGVRAEGATGGVLLERVRVVASLGAGVGIVSAARARLAAVEIVGPLETIDPSSLPVEPTWAETATFGLVLDASGTAELPIELDRVSVSGFAEVGVYAREAFVRWVAGGSSGNRYVGLLATGGVLDLEDVELSRTVRGARPIAYGAVFRDAVVGTTNLHLEGGEGYGILQDATQASHEGITVVDQEEAGIWIQHGASAEVAGATLTRCALGGIVSVASTGLVVRDSLIESTRLARTVDELYGEMMLGDGIQLVGANAAMEIRDVELRDNARIGLLLELEGGALTSTTIAGVVVSGSGGARGAIVQGGVAPAAWDDGVSRDAATMGNDAATMDPLSFASVRATTLPPAYPTPCD